MTSLFHSDYTESKMVKRVTTNAAGSKAMQILLGRDFGGGSRPRNADASGTGIDALGKVCARLSPCMIITACCCDSGRVNAGDVRNNYFSLSCVCEL